MSIRRLLWLCFVILATSGPGPALADWQTTVNDAIANWNGSFGTNVQAVGWTDDGLIMSEAERLATVQQMTDPTMAWMPSGDVGMPAAMTALRVADDPGIPASEISAWVATVNGLVMVGHRRLTIQWMKAGYGGFTTTCVVDANTIVYDDMITNIAQLSPSPIPGEGIQLKRCFTGLLQWIWELGSGTGSRGSITADNVPVCSSHGTVIACDKNCVASMILGEARIECRSTKLATAECCQLEFNWAFACGFKKIKVAADGYSLEVEGIIGSSGAGNGSCTDCCAATPVDRDTWGKVKVRYR